LAPPAPRRNIVLIRRKHRQPSLAAAELRSHIRDYARTASAEGRACPL
jgi:hypothetical protein